MAELDYKKDPAYKAATTPAILNIPSMRFIMIDGEGGPEGDDETEFQRAMQALFGIIYTIKFWDKKYPAPPGYVQFTLAPVEGLWWTKSGKAFDSTNPSDWKWTLMLRVPDFVTPEFFREVVQECVAKKQSTVYEQVRLDSFTEGLCVQIMHFGPYSEEQFDIDTMHTYARKQGYTLTGKHHELYFGDPRLTKPENLRTILRHPIQKAVTEPASDMTV